ncbi:MAG: hypothetical protein FWG33_02885 [Oscillospiraceae bacterium]|nr:hypothetical protein [Oscillospiraceae bacterium]
MKKRTALLIVIAMCLMLAAFTACAHEEDEIPVPEDLPVVDNELDDPIIDDENDVEDYDYDYEINDFIDSFESLMESLVELAKIADGVDENDDVFDEEIRTDWCETFGMIKLAAEAWLTWLEIIVEDVPEEFEDLHFDIISAVETVCEVMSSFEDAVESALDGNTEDFYAGLSVFIVETEIADDLWNEAVAA